MAIEVRTLLDGQVIARYRLLVPRAFQHPFTVRGWVLLKYDHDIWARTDDFSLRTVVLT